MKAVLVYNDGEKDSEDKIIEQFSTYSYSDTTDRDKMEAFAVLWHQHIQVLMKDKKYRVIFS